MTVELPFAPVDTLIREANPDIRVSSGAAETLARRIQEKGSSVAVVAAENATRDERKTIMPSDFDGVEGIDSDARIDGDELLLPIAPVDRIARLKIDDYRVSQDARLVLADYLEGWANEVAVGAGKLAQHADRRTVQSEDVDAYLEICAGWEI